MKNVRFDSISVKIKKFQYKILTNEKIKELIIGISQNDYSDNKMYKLIYYLKLRGYLINLKKNLYYVKSPNDSFSEDELENRIYWQVLSMHCKENIHQKRYIGGLKALEIALLMYTIPDEITIVNQDKQGNETLIFDKKILLKTYQTKGKNLFSTFGKLTQTISISNTKLQVAKPELAILETLYNSSILQKAYGDELIKKWLKRSRKAIQYDLFETVLKSGKHNSSINRLSLIAQEIDSDIAERLRKIIKRYGYIMY